MTLAEISSSTVFERSSVSGPSSVQVWFAIVPSEDVQWSTGRGGVRQVVVSGSTAPGDLRQAGDRRVLAGRRDGLLGRRLVDVGEAHPLHRVEVIEVAPEFLEAVRGRQRVGVVAQVVLAELAGGVAEIEQELGERRRAGPQVGRASGNFRQGHADAQRIHAGEEGGAPGGAALLGVVVGEHRAFVADAVDVGRLADHQAAVVDRRLHPADVVAHDEEDVRLLRGASCAAAGPAPRAAQPRASAQSAPEHRRRSLGWVVSSHGSLSCCRSCRRGRPSLPTAQPSGTSLWRTAWRVERREHLGRQFLDERAVLLGPAAPGPHGPPVLERRVALGEVLADRSETPDRGRTAGGSPVPARETGRTAAASFDTAMASTSARHAPRCRGTSARFRPDLVRYEHVRTSLTGRDVATR